MPVNVSDLATQKALNDRQAFGLTLYGEARGEPQTGRVAVAGVIQNRLADGRWGTNFRSVCLWPWQFSCWKPEGGSANYAVVMAMARALLEGGEDLVLPAALKSCLAIADQALAGTLADTTNGATHYLTELLYASHPPSWAVVMEQTARIGGHLFLRDRAQAA